MDSIFNDNMTDLITDIGKTIKYDNGESDCFNCGFDRVRKQSNNIYNTSDQDRAAEYNKEFQDGSTCGVCGGRGKIRTWGSLTALVNWQAQNYVDHEQVQLSARRAEIKVAYDNYETVRKAEFFQIPVVTGSYMECKKVSSPDGFGIGGRKFMVFYVEAIR